MTIDLPPGVFRNGTAYQSKGRWYDANLVRWYDGLLQPVGGWGKVSTSQLTGKCRAMLSWVDNSGSRWIGMGTNSKLYVNGGAETIFDITPVGLVAGDADAIETLGYGGGTYGAGAYGTARTSSGGYIPPAQWTLDTWGQNLVGCSDADGRLFEWSLNTGTPAAVISGAPTGCDGLIVSEERHLIAFGASGNGRSVKWSDKEDNTNWTAGADNEAGGFELQSETGYVAACRVRGQILITTQSDAHVMRYIGQPFVYNRERVGVGCGGISRQGLISVESRAFWIGQEGFWQFDGATVQPLLCEVADYVFSDFSSVQQSKICSGHNPKFGEVWWFYPSSQSLENDRYVIYNYRENHWSIGNLPRAAWHSGEVFGYPHAVSPDGYLYRHEDGWLDDGASRFSQIFAESGVIEVGQGERVTHVTQLLPDERTQGETTITFKVRYTPTGTEYTHGPYAVRSDGYTDTRFSGRQMQFKIVPTVDGDFRVGALRMNSHLRGKR